MLSPRLSLQAAHSLTSQTGETAGENLPFEEFKTHCGKTGEVVAWTLQLCSLNTA